MSRVATFVFVALIGLACSSPAQDLAPATPTVGQPDPHLGSEERVVEVMRVIDGDTIDVVFPDGVTDRVRLLGVDTPEAQGQNQPYEYAGTTDTVCLDEWGVEASIFATKALDWREVALVSDPSARRMWILRPSACIRPCGRPGLRRRAGQDGICEGVHEGDSNWESNTWSCRSSPWRATWGYGDVGRRRMLDVIFRQTP